MIRRSFVYQEQHLVQSADKYQESYKKPHKKAPDICQEPSENRFFFFPLG